MLQSASATLRSKHGATSTSRLFSSAKKALKMKKIVLPSVVVVTLLFGVAFVYAPNTDQLTTEIAELPMYSLESSLDIAYQREFCRGRAKFFSYKDYAEFVSCRRLLAQSTK